MRLEALAAEIRFRQLVALNHRAHGAVEHEDASDEQFFQPCSNIHVIVQRLSGASRRAISTVNGSPGSRDPTRTCTSGQPRTGKKPLEVIVLEAEPSIAHAIADPFLIVLAQVEDEHPPARPHHARGFLDGLRRIGRMVQRLREQRHVDRGVLERQLFHVATLPA